MSSVIRIERIKQQQGGDAMIYVLHMEGTSNEGRTNFENRLNPNFISDFNRALDEVLEESKGKAAALVTVGHGKHYSNGLDLEFMTGMESAAERTAFLKSVELLCYRILTLPMVTVAAVNGHAFAGGMLLSLAHDYRIGNEEKGFWCMSEIDIPTALPPGLSALINAKLNANIRAHMLITGARVNSKEMHRHAAVWDTGKGEAEVLGKAVDLAAQWASKAHPVMTEIKQDVWDVAAKELLRGTAIRAKL